MGSKPVLLTCVRLQGAIEAFDFCRWGLAAERLKQLASFAPPDRVPVFTAVEAAVHAFGAWDRLRYAGVGAQMTDAVAQLAGWRPPRHQRALVELLHALRTAARRVECLEAGDVRALAADRVANADRRARIELWYDKALLLLTSAVLMVSSTPTFSIRSMTRPRDSADEYRQMRALALHALKLTEADIVPFPRLAEFDLASLV